MSKNTITFSNQDGQTMAEYAVVLGVITFAIITSLSLLSGAIGAAFEYTLELVSSAS